MSSASGFYTRRQVLQLAGAFTLYLQGCSHSGSVRGTGNEDFDNFLSSNGPIQNNLGVDDPAVFFGDNHTQAHQALWDLAGFLKKNPAPLKAESQVPLIIIGGGLSGLTTAYLLQDLKPMVLEQSPRFGGNSQGQSWRGIPYPIGAAYFVSPEENTELGRILKELGVMADAHQTAGESQALVDGKKHGSFFSGNIEPGEREKFRRFVDSMKRYLNTPALYPTMPTEISSERKWVNQFDTRSLRAQLETEIGGPLPWSLEQWVDHYCWSSFGASSSEVSAAAGINFLACEFGNIRFFPEGNSAIAERLLSKMGPDTSSRFLSEALVLKVEKLRNGAWSVLFVDKLGKSRRVEAGAVVMACPKFVAGRVLADIEPRRLKAISAIQYRAYCVANALIDGPFNLETYDAFLLDKKNRGEKIEERAKRAGITDILCGSYRSGEKNTVLSLYRAFPYASGRAELLSPDSWKRFHGETHAQLKDQILPALGIAADRVRGIRLARWGHPMPVPRVGCYRDGAVDILHEPFRESAFFVHQDNWLLPCMETAMGEAVRWTPRIRTAVAHFARS